MSLGALDSPDAWLSGFCENTARTPFDLIDQDCKLQDKGSWNLESKTWARSAAECRHRCESCKRCIFYSYSHDASDCSWFTQCNVGELQQQYHFRTQKLNRTLELVVPAQKALEQQAQSHRACAIPPHSASGRTLADAAHLYKAWKTPVLTSTYHAAFAATRQKLRRVLEIGVFKGFSLAMWASYFPRARIVGVDHFTGRQGTGLQSHLSGAQLLASARRVAGRWRTANGAPRIVLRSANQAKPAELDALVQNLSASDGAFDLVLDDGSHRPVDQLATFARLFPLVAPGGWYVIEDIGSSWNRMYGHLPQPHAAHGAGRDTGHGTRRWSKHRTNAEVLDVIEQTTALGMVTGWLQSGFMREGKIRSALASSSTYLEQEIECMHFAAAHDGATVLIRKRRQQRPAPL